MCRVCELTKTFQPLNTPQVCTYTLDELKEMLLVSQSPLKNYIQSQINVYATNCNIYVPRIESLINRQA